MGGFRVSKDFDAPLPEVFVSAATVWEIAHAEQVRALPAIHRDPFDRMLIAQAQSERVPLLTRDRAMMAYGEHAMILRYPEP